MMHTARTVRTVASVGLSMFAAMNSAIAQPGPNPCLGRAANKITCVLFQAITGGSQLAVPLAGIPSGNSFIVSQLTAALPLPSPASGFTYTFDPVTGAYTRSTESFGPALAERAETLGRRRVSFGTAFQRFVFDKADGVDIRNFTSIIPAGFFPIPVPDPTVVIPTNANLSASLNQYTLFASYGVADRVDVSIGVPFNTLHLGIAIRASINGVPVLANQAQRTATGIGDVTLQLKANVLKSEKAGLALGVAVRTPTGDAYDGLGAGAIGIRQFVVASYSGRWFAPHLNLGYEWNGRSTLAGDFYAGQKASLPRQFIYAAGFDSAIHKRLTVNLDIIGRELFNTERAVDRWNILNGPYPKGSVNITNEAIGFKVNPVGNLLFGANVLFRLNEGGLRSKAVPLFTLTYTL